MPGRRNHEEIVLERDTDRNSKHIKEIGAK
jgi:hypothetical protein